MVSTRYAGKARGVNSVVCQSLLRLPSENRPDQVLNQLSGFVATLLFCSTVFSSRQCSRIRISFFSHFKKHDFLRFFEMTLKKT